MDSLIDLPANKCRRLRLLQGWGFAGLIAGFDGLIMSLEATIFRGTAKPIDGPDVTFKRMKLATKIFLSSWVRIAFVFAAAQVVALDGDTAISGTQVAANGSGRHRGGCRHFCRGGDEPQRQTDEERCPRSPR